MMLVYPIAVVAFIPRILFQTKPRTQLRREIIDIWGDRNETTRTYIQDLENTGRRRSQSYIDSLSPREKKIAPMVYRREKKKPKNTATILDEKARLLLPVRTLNRAINGDGGGSISSDSGNFQIEKDTRLYNFSRIGGYKEIKSELNQVVHMMTHKENYTKYNVRIPRGILLEGPPGNGKTLLAKCFAGETGSHFVRCCGSDFNEKYIGVGSARLRELFRLGKENAPSVIFIDEFDAIGRRRGGADDTSGGERDTTLNQLLALMDGFDKDNNVLVIAATNRLDILDPAVTRPGRFDKIIHIQNPDSDTRKAIIDIHIQDKPIETDTETITRMTSGFSGAMIENMLNEATLWGIRNDNLPIVQKDLENIRQRLLFGVAIGKKNMSDAILKRIAIHETGHLVNALVSEFYEQPIRVTIDSESHRSFGMTMFQKDDVDDGIFIRDYLDDQVRVLLGGRAAEEIVYGHSVSSGSVSDLEMAFQVVKRMILEFGMGNHIVYPFLSEEYKKRIDDEIHQYIQDSYSMAKDVLLDNIDLFNVFVEKLYEETTLVEKDILDIIASHPFKKK